MLGFRLIQHAFKSWSTLSLDELQLVLLLMDGT